MGVGAHGKSATNLKAVGKKKERLGGSLIQEGLREVWGGGWWGGGGWGGVWGGVDL